MRSIASFIASFLGAILLIVVLFTQFSFDRKKEHPSGNSENPWHPPVLPEKIDFAGEAVPLHRWEVKEQLDREILYNYYSASNILYMLKRANRYFPYIEERLKANGIPDDFKYLCVAESNLMNAVSRVGAAGYWQFMPKSAPGYSLEVNSLVDERYNYMKATDAACAYLNDAYNKFGTWTAAAASYNCGMGGYNSQASFQGSKNYYDLLLPEETQRYIFRILAFKYLMGNADKLGYKLSEDELYDPVAVRKVVVNKSISNLASFAREQGTSYKMLKWMNPWLRGRSLPVKPGKTYELLIPTE